MASHLPSMAMKVTLKSSCMVHPAHPTWSGRIPMSEFDQSGVVSDVQVIYFYKPGQDWLTPKDRIFETLRHALSHALVHFYPLAGRLHPLHHGRFELDCNDTGVELIRAESDAKFDELGDFLNSPAYLECLIPQIDYAALPLEEFPMLSVQLTEFRCGGVSLSFTTSHVAADGLSAVQFLTRLAEVAKRGWDAEEAPPCFNTKLLRAGEGVVGAPPRFSHEEYCELPPVLVGESDGEKEKKKETTDALLKLSGKQVEALKNEANRARRDEDVASRPYTRYEVITAHVWRTACKARGHVSEQPTAIGITVDVRRRVQPPLPRTYFFNGVMQVVAKTLSGDITTEPLGHAAGRIRETVERVTNEYVQSSIDLLKGMEDLTEFQDIYALKTGEGPFYGNPNLGVISWMGFPLQGLDFGWGKEIFMAPRTHDFDGDVLILPTCDGDGSLIVALCLQVEHMEDFRHIFYQDIPSSFD